MVYLNKKEAEEITRALSRIKNKKAKDLIKKINSPQKRLKYVESPNEVKQLLKIAFKEQRKVKINYYSLSSDEVTNRIVDIYQLHKDCIVAYCNLRNEERTFVIRRINKAALLDEKYSIPNGWKPESIIK